MGQRLKYAVTKPCTIHGVVRMWLTKLGWKLIKANCTHEEKQTVFEDYPDRYTHYWCEDCPSDIYEGWD